MWKMFAQDRILNSPLFNVSAFAVFWAFQLFVIKLAFLAGVDPITFTVQAWIAYFFYISVIIFLKGGGVFKGISGRILLWLALALIIHSALGSVLSNMGIALTSAINAGFLVRFSLITTTLLAWIVLKEQLTKSKILAVIVMLFGVYLISTQGQKISPHVGDVLIMGACFSWSIGNVLIKKSLKNDGVDPLVVSFLRPIFGLPFLLIMIYLLSGFPSPVQKMFMVNLLNLKYIPYIFVSGLFDVINTVFLYRTLKVSSASYMTLMSNTTPVIVAILAILFLNERMTGVQFVGAGLIILAGVITYYLKIDEH